MFFFACLNFNGQNTNNKFDDILYELTQECRTNSNFNCIATLVDSLQIVEEQKENWSNIAAIKYFKLTYAKQAISLTDYKDLLLDNKEFLSKYKNKIGDSWDTFWYNTQQRIYGVEYEKGNLVKARKSFDNFQEDLRSIEGKDTAHHFVMFGNTYFLGVIARELGDYESAISYYNENLKIARNHLGERFAKSPLTYKHLGDAHKKMNRPKQALKFYNLAESFSSPRRSNGDIFYTHLHILMAQADCLSNEGKVDSALYKMKEVENLTPKDSPHFGEIYLQYGNIYEDQNDLSKAKAYYQKALELNQKIYGNKHYKVSQIYNLLGNVERTEKNWKKTLKCADDALNALYLNSSNQDSLKNVISSIDHQQILIKSIGLKSQALLELAKSNNNPTYQKQAWALTNQSIQQIEAIKIGLGSNEDKLHLIGNNYNVYELALEAAYYNGQSKQSNAFQIMEKSKATILFEALQKSKALTKAGLPDSLLEKEAQLAHELSKLQDEIANESNVIQISTSETHSKFYEKKKNYNLLLRQLEQEYPKYYALKYQNTIATPQDIQNNLLQKNQSIIEYFVGDHNIYIFVINPNKVHFEKIAKDFPLDEWVTRLVKNISANPNTLNNPEQNAQAFCQTAFDLHQKLIAPITDKLNQKITIIPDGILGFIPFECLLTQSGEQHKNKFHLLDYLHKKHHISYAHSASLLYNNQYNTATKFAEQNVLALAPSFSNMVAANLADSSSQTLNQFDSLLYNVEEVKTILTTLEQGKTLIGENANKNNFKSLAPKYSILHFATHGKVNDQNPNYSQIAFTQNGTPQASDNLFVKDLYNLNLNADLVTLSACETGIGKMQRGEGLMSLARGFTYAGAKSIVTTLWEVNAQSTTEIMKSFYAFLKQGQSKDEALHNAQLQFFEDHPTYTHPYFWAAYIPMGNMQALYPNKKPANKWYFVAGLAFLGLFGCAWCVKGFLKA